MHRGIIKRFLAFTLAILTIATSIYVPDIVYADEDDKKKTEGVGTEGVGGGGSSAGTFDDDNTGYRMYFINKDGERVSNIVDIVMNNPKNATGSAGIYYFNTRFEAASATESADYRRRLATTGENGLSFSDGQLMGPPIKYVKYKDSNGKTKGRYEGQGEEFREWMMAGAEMLQGSSGGNISSNFTGTPDKEEIDEEVVKQIKNIIDEVFYNASSYLYNLHKSPAAKTYTRDTAINMALDLAVQELWALMDKYGSEYRLIISGGIREIRTKLEESTPYNGWKGSTGDEIDEEDVDVRDDASLLDRIFDIAYAAEDKSKGQEDNGNGHITELLNHNDLFIFIEGTVNIKNATLKNGSEVVDVIETMLANELYLIVEPLFWFVPAKSKLDKNDEDKDGSKTDYVIGDACNKWFYGTPVNYGQWYLECKAKGVWTDGGQGGWYNKALNTTGAQSLIIPKALEGNSGNIVNEFNGDTDIRKNDYLGTQYKNDGYAMHYYYGKQGELPEIPTYDIVSTDGQENKEPHPAQDPDDPKLAADGYGTIDRTSGELEVEGISSLYTQAALDGIIISELGINLEAAERGYKNHSRTITIVKTYSKQVVCDADDPDKVGLDEDDVPYKYEHVGTYITFDTPGTISIQHEPEYKVGEWFTSEQTVYETFGIVPANKSTALNEKSWGTLKTVVPQAFWSRNEKYDWTDATDDELKAGTEVYKIKMGLAADQDYDSDDPEAGEPEIGYYENTLYIHLISKPKELKTHTFDDPSSPGMAPDPRDPDEGGPLTPEEEAQCVYNIVKVYETESITPVSEELLLSEICVRKRTAGLIEIEDERSIAGYSVYEWFWSTELVEYGESWDDIKSRVGGVLGSGEGAINEVDIRNPDDLTEPRTLYVNLRNVVVGDPI